MDIICWVLRYRGRRLADPSKCGQYLDVISVAHGEDARVERDQTHPAATGECQQVRVGHLPIASDRRHVTVAH